MKHKDKTFKINLGDVVMIKGEEKNRGQWKISIVNHFVNHFYIVVQLSIGKKLIDQPIQLFYPLELQCEGIVSTNEDVKKQIKSICNGFSSKTNCCLYCRVRLNDIAIEEHGNKSKPIFKIFRQMPSSASLQISLIYNLHEQNKISYFKSANYLPNVNNGTTKARFETSPKSTVKTPEQHK